MFRKRSDCSLKCKNTKIYRDFKIFINKNKVMRKRRVIQLPRGAAGKMCKSLNIGKTTLYAALNYTSNSDEAKRTRKVALTKYGGVEFSKPIF